jgi:hypothetical protein
MKPIERLSQLQISIAPLHDKVVRHPLFDQINNKKALNCFLTHHVFAVWDFMCLLKVLYFKLTTTTLPWQPSPYPESVHLIGQIMNEEEADVFVMPSGDLKYCSHFEAYLAAMAESGANALPIQAFLAGLTSGTELSDISDKMSVPPVALAFVQSTFAALKEPIHCMAAGFVFAREGITGDLFTRLLKQKQLILPEAFKVYLERHVDLDMESHYPKALRMLQSLCGEDPEKWQEATLAASKALQARYDFWTGILGAL